MSNKFNIKPKTTQESIVKLDHKSHILKLSDTYIGSTDKTSEEIWYYDETSQKIVKGLRTFIPGEYKIYDEIVVNAFDQFIRTFEAKECQHRVKNIKINIDQENGTISVKNDGEGIRVEMHEKEKVYIPELIFGHLLTSSNYDQSKIKHVGGRNGYGAKLTNIFSTMFYLETIDANVGKKFKQTFYDNMSRKDKPSITKNSGKPYTMIKYKPDYNRFKVNGLTNDMYNIMKRRVYDLSACTGNNCSVSFNDIKIDCKNLDKYASYYLGDVHENPRAYERISSRWEIVVALNPFQSFEQVSFVNGICTYRGGKHVDYILNQVVKKLGDYILKKKKIKVKSNFIKDNIMLFIKCAIDNPAFNSQTKEYLTTNKEKFGSKCEISDKFINNHVAKIGIIERAIELNELKENKNLKKTDGKKQNRIKGIPKLEDANWAGGKKSKECTLILTEGDSAKAMAMAGMAIVGRDRFGVFPLKGKILNVQDPSNHKKMPDNAEINSIKKALGLETGKTYKNTDDLRYGKILCLTDQDEDGTHIKGLLFNLFKTLWPSLYKHVGFLNSMLTPVIKAKKGKQEIQFYSVKDYDKWKIENTHGWNIKYYKGLGTSTPKEAREYFKELKIVNYTSINEEDDNLLNLAFGKQDNSSKHRKDWLNSYNKEETLDYNSKSISMKDFINYDLIHFSNSDNIRSLPSVIDGLKPSQRKILYCCFKRKLEKEIRVAQLAGYVSEHGAYHHGEASLQGTIVNMAQDFVGANNINLLEPIGQFGSRILGGKDAAQPRYIHTKLCEATKKIYNKLDEPLYQYNDDDGVKVEPKYYIPILPMLLVNGTSGIGTGWSTEIPMFNPSDIIENIKLHFEGKPLKEMSPYYRGFKGTITKITNNYYQSKGIYTIGKGKIVIKELPIGMWTDKYKLFLEDITIDSKTKNSKQMIRYYNSYCTDVDIHFEVFMSDDLISDLNVIDCKFGCTKLEKALKLVTPINMNNMVAFDKNNKIVKYENVNDILVEYISVRQKLYVDRKQYMLEELQKDIDLLEIKIRFINDFIEEKIQIIRQNKSKIEAQLVKLTYPKVNDSYDYLLKMPIYNLTQEKIEEFEKSFQEKKASHQNLSIKNETQLWKNDLNEVSKYLNVPNKKIKFNIKN